jgi:hypothetical protein
MKLSNQTIMFTLALACSFLINCCSANREQLRRLPRGRPDNRVRQLEHKGTKHRTLKSSKKSSSGKGKGSSKEEEAPVVSTEPVGLVGCVSDLRTCLDGPSLRFSVVVENSFLPDELDLTVVPPSGGLINYLSPKNETSLGNFFITYGPYDFRSFMFDFVILDVGFPLSALEAGEYNILVSTRAQEDVVWTLSTILDGQIVGPPLQGVIPAANMDSDPIVATVSALHSSSSEEAMSASSFSVTTFIPSLAN